MRYAGASGDFNPIHWSDRIATAVGLPGVIAHGMFTMALVARAVGRGGQAAPRVGGSSAPSARPRSRSPTTTSGVVVEIGGTVKSVDDGLTTIALDVTCGGQKVLGMPRAVVRA